MIGWIIALVLLVLILRFPLGVWVRYDDTGPYLAIRLGPVTRQLIPRAARPVKAKKTKQAKKQKPAKKTAATTAKKPKQGGTLSDFWPFVQLVLDFLNAFRWKLLIQELTIHVSFGGKDPAQTAITYGRAQAILGTVYPRFASQFRIRKEDIGVHCAFTEPKLTIYAALRIRLLVGDLLVLGIVYGIRALKAFLAFRKKRKQPAADAADTLSDKGGAAT